MDSKGVNDRVEAGDPSPTLDTFKPDKLKNVAGFTSSSTTALMGNQYADPIYCPCYASPGLFRVQMDTESQLKDAHKKPHQSRQSIQTVGSTEDRAMQLTESCHHPQIQRCGQPKVPVDGARLSQPTDPTGAINGGH